METAGIYGLANSLGHKAISFNVILANRANLVVSQAAGPVSMQQYIGLLMDRIITL
jgi:uridine phosphorylase